MLGIAVLPKCSILSDKGEMILVIAIFQRSLAIDLPIEGIDISSFIDVSLLIYY
jgi:hypothetical protein